ncbi:MAG: hypothetical protein ACREXW_11510 [Gammaproteobacteria bacterium]
MLALYDKTEAIPGVIVWRDHQEKGQFYYCSEVPRIAKNNGVPAISFIKFRRDITDNPDFQEGDSLGGGILNFTVDLSLTEDELDDIKREIKRAFPDVPNEVRLAPVSVRDGEVRLSVTRDAADLEGAPPEAPRGLQLFEEVHGSTKPSLIGTQRASFTVMLNREMATAMEQTLRGGVSMFSVLYSLKFLGMSPAMHVKVKADYERIYNHLQTALGVQGQIQVVSIAADIAASFETLREKSVIVVEITEFTDDKDLKAKGEAAWEWFKGQLVADFFNTKMPPPAIMQPAAGGGMMGMLQNLFGAISQGAGSGSLLPTRGAAAGGPPNAGPPAVGPSDQVPTTAESNQAQAAARSSGGAGGGNVASELSPFRVGFSLKFAHQVERRTREFDYRLQSAIEQEANPNGMFSSIVDGFNLDKIIFEVKMDDPFFDRILTTVSMGQDLAALGIGSVAVNMEYPAERREGVDADHVDGFLFRPGETETQSFTTFLNDRRDRDYRYQMTITFDPATEWRGKNSQVVTPWTTSAAAEVPLAPMDSVERLDVEIGLSTTVSSDLIAQVEVEVLYEDAASGFRDNRTYVLTPGGASHHWRLRLADDAPLKYRHRTRYFFKEGNLRVETPFTESEQPTIVVNPPFQDRIRVMINPMLLDSANLLQAIVDLEYTEPDTGYIVTHREEFDGFQPLANRSLIIPTLAKNPGPLKFSTTVIKMDGVVRTQEDQTSESGIILLSEGAGVVQRIKVRLPNNTIGDRIAVKVDLTGTGEQPDQTTALFTSSQLAEQMVALVQPDAASRAFDFQITGYDTLGSPQAIAAGRSSDQTFIVPLN